MDAVGIDDVVVVGRLRPLHAGAVVGHEVDLLLAFEGVGERGHADLVGAGLDRRDDRVELGLLVFGYESEHLADGVHQVDVVAHDLPGRVLVLVRLVRDVDPDDQPSGASDLRWDEGGDRRHLRHVDVDRGDLVRAFTGFVVHTTRHDDQDGEQDAEPASNPRHTTSLHPAERTNSL